MSQAEIDVLKALQKQEMKDLLSPHRLSKKRREIRVQSWQELMEQAA